MALATADTVPPRSWIASAFFMVAELKHTFSRVAKHAFPVAVYGDGMNYGERLQAAMTHARKTRKDVARALGITAQAVGDVVRGKSRAFTAENSAKAAVFLGVSAHWLSTGEGSMEPSGAVLVVPAMTIQAGNVTPITKISVRDAVMALGQALAGRDVEMELTPASSLLKTLALQPDRASEVADRLEGLLGGGGEDQAVFSRKTR